MKHLFIGLDVHKSSWSVTIQEGSVVLKRFYMEPSPEPLMHIVSKYFPDHTVECFCVGYHIYRHPA